MNRTLSILGLLFLFGSILSAENPSATAPGKLADVNGTKLYYQECGAGETAVVLMHDGVANSAVWDDVWPSFCGRFHTIRYDRRGYGHSPETKSSYYEADDLAALINNRGVKRAALVASSHGGEVAMEFALRYPELVSQLIVVGPGVTGFAYSEHFLMREYSNQQSQKVDDLREAAIKDRYLIVPGHEAAQKELRAILTAAPQDLTHNDMPLPEPALFPNVREIRVPTLILVGSEDIADNEAVAGALAVSIPGASRIVVPDTGHLMYLEKPQQFFDLVNRFLTLHVFASSSDNCR